MHLQVCPCSQTSICLCFWRVGITPSMEVHSSALEEINPVSCKGTRLECSNTTLNWATGSTQQIAQREGGVNKNTFCTCPDKYSIPVWEADNTFNYRATKEKKKVKRDVTFFFLNRHYDNELQQWGDTLHPGSLAIFLQSNEFGQSAKHLDHSIPRTITLLSPNNLSDFLAGLIQKNAKFKLFAKHLYKNVKCAFAELELAIINVSATKRLKSWKQRFKLPSKHYARDRI